jgi:oxygen-independent coproporphyrinogen-3 oxidase
MAGVYISFPFCSQKCSFCNFASGVQPAGSEAIYAEALLAEIRGFEWKWTPETVYLGGGTPSQMPPADLEQVLSAIPGRPWREATIEAAPGSLTPERVEKWVSLGLNRVSLGVQSFATKELARTGRKHNAAVVESDVALLRSYGIENFNLDLIAGLPFQTRESWKESLDWIERLQAPHVSVYLFEIDEDSRLGLEILQGGGRYSARDVPSEELAAELYETAVDRLAGMGISRYEISNFARPGFESVHNLKYWLLEPYAGFGADAHSFDGVSRVSNVETVEEYLGRWRAGSGFTSSEGRAHPEEERFFVGLRLSQGIELRAEEWSLEPVERFLGLGLLERAGSRLRLTRQGVLFSNEVFQEFVNT